MSKKLPADWEPTQLIPNPRHEAFAQLVASGGYAQTDAARIVGLSPDAIHATVCKHPEIKRRVAALQGMSAQQVIDQIHHWKERVREIVDLDLYPEIDFDGESVHIKPLDEWPLEKRRAVKKIKIRKNTTRNKKDDREYTTTDIEVEFHDKIAALNMLGRHLGSFEEDNAQRSEVHNHLHLEGTLLQARR